MPTLEHLGIYPFQPPQYAHTICPLWNGSADHPKPGASPFITYSKQRVLQLKENILQQSAAPIEVDHVHACQTCLRGYPNINKPELNMQTAQSGTFRLVSA